MKDLLQYILYKIFAVALVVSVINLVFIFMYPSVFESWYFTVTIVLFSLFVAVDKILQPSVIYGKSEEERKDLRQIMLLVIFLLLNPIMLALPYVEYRYLSKNILPQVVVTAFWIVGSLVLIIGGTILSYSRYIIGKLGSPVVGIESEHKLVTTGPYRFVRHPIYAGAMLLFLGFTLSFSGVISSIVILGLLVVIFHKKMISEEKLLISTFGEEYLEYTLTTRKLIPLVY